MRNRCSEQIKDQDSVGLCWTLLSLVRTLGASTVDICKVVDCPHSAISRIESLVTDFLEQLASQSQSTQLASDRESKGESDNNVNVTRKKVQLELVNRSKPTSKKSLRRFALRRRCRLLEPLTGA